MKIKNNRYNKSLAAFYIFAISFMSILDFKLTLFLISNIMLILIFALILTKKNKK